MFKASVTYNKSVVRSFAGCSNSAEETVINKD